MLICSKMLFQLFITCWFIYDTKYHVARDMIYVEISTDIKKKTVGAIYTIIKTNWKYLANMKVNLLRQKDLQKKFWLQQKKVA